MEHFKELKPPAKKVLSAVEQKAGRLASIPYDEIIKLLSISNAKLLLLCGEMTAQELRTVRAVLNYIKTRMVEHPFHSRAGE